MALLNLPRGGGSDPGNTGAPVLGGPNIGPNILIPGMSASPDIPAGGVNDEEFNQNGSGVPVGWTQFNAGTGASVDTNTAYSCLHYKSGSAQASVDRWEGIYKAAPSIPYTVTACLVSVIPFGQFFRAGIAVMDGTTTGKIMTATWLTGTGPAENTFTNWTTSNDFSQTALIGNPGLQPRIYLRLVVHSATNIDMLYSFDGHLWTTQIAGKNWLANATFVAVACSPFSQQGEMLVDWIRFS